MKQTSNFRRRMAKVALLLLACHAPLVTVTAQQLAFPGAQGWGRFAQGGRTGSVYHVTNLNDSGSGSLRDAVSQPNRIVVFDVAGVIRIKSRIVFKNNLYVAGQTAPGEGVTVYGDGVSFSGASNSIIRYMRFRMGAVGTKDKDCAGVANGTNMIFDHCSFAWGQDENFSINPDGKGAIGDITLQNCIVGQGLMTHSAGGLMQADHITLYRILLCDNSTRNFKVKGTNQYVNNIVYNWKNYAYNMGGDSSGESFVNIEGNLFINGPAGGGSGLSGGNADFHFYGADNWQDSNRNGSFDPTALTDDGGGNRVDTPYDYPALPTVSATTLIDDLLPDVGASLPYRDLTDCYMVDEVLSMGQKGVLITKENELFYGTPDTWRMFAGSKPADTDGDGMPDDWEIANGCDPTKDDAMVIDTNGYANIENYINSISRADRQHFVRAPLAPTLLEATPRSLTIGWSDFTDNEEGFTVELRGAGGQSVQVTTGPDVQQATLTADWLTPATAYTVVVGAFAGAETAYAEPIQVKTRPEAADIIDCDTFVGDDAGNWLIAPSEHTVVTLDQPTEKSAVVVRTDADVTLTGAGYVAGQASLNKAGTGTLRVETDQQYTGASVLHGGVWEFQTLRDGGLPSGLGASQEFAQNWVMDGGIYRYIGATTATNRSATLYNDTEFDIRESAVVVSMSGSITGAGDLTINGGGQLLVKSKDFFGFDGNLILKGGELKLNDKTVSEAGLGKAAKLVLAGGTFTTVGQNEGNVTYNFPIEVADGTTSRVSFDLWNINKCDISGNGTLEWDVHYLREYIEGNWDGFTGRLVIIGTGKDKQSQFAMSKSGGDGHGIQNASIMLKGNASIQGSKNASTYTLGGLSGEKGTFLGGFNVKAKGEGTWLVGTANTDEEFAGIIDNYDQARSHAGTTSIEKTGSGDWRLTGNNVYAGTTKVSGGRLIVNGSHTGTGAVTVARGGTLAGTGTLAAAVTLNNGSVLQVGDTLVDGRGLTFGSTLKVNRGAAINVLADASQSNTLTLKKTLTLLEGSILQINGGEMAEAPAGGTAYRVFSLAGGTISGEFAEIQPAVPGSGLVWDVSELYTQGILRVADDMAVSPISADSPVRRDYFSPSGIRTSTPTKGLYLERSIDGGGKTKTRKVIR